MYRQPNTAHPPMRHFIFAIAVLAISLLGFTSSSTAQDTLVTKAPWVIKTGFVFTPQGSWNFKDESTKQFATLITVMVLNKGKSTSVPFYQWNSTAIGHAFIYHAKPWISPYTVVQNNLLDERLYVSIGAMTPLPVGNLVLSTTPFNAFIEIGNTFPANEPTLYTGVFIGLTRPIKGVRRE